ncbi:SLIT and NTRK-like protein 4 [Anopheles nili]|uniref:SLIT and NTRK-like protein 4 n=1 Tax=Anopheles nili TaxID=185578 RepID=UPI00237B7092|nr:SLIT and NTRK-like protein 4 [Anopheles nili]
METPCKILILLVLLWCGIGANSEDVSSLCSRCTCLIANQTSAVMSYDLLDCSRSNLQSMITEWPEQIDTNDPEREIVFSLSGNSIETLEQLPATNTTLVFTCRHSKVKSLANGLFIDSPNVLRVDLSWNMLDGEQLTAEVFRGPYNDHENTRALLLDELDLRSNAITYLLENAFEHITSLRQLSLARNPLKQITQGTAKALAQLVNIEILDLSFASLTDIEATAFVGMHGLRELYLQGNQLTELPEAIFQLSALVSLHVGENPIEILNIPSPLDQLQHLNISSMPFLHTIEVESFQNIKSLQTLTGRNNSALEIFDLSVLRHVAGLQELDLSQSNLKHLSTPLEEGFHEELPQPEPKPYVNVLEVLGLRENPWHCDCDLQQILKQINYQRLLDPDEETRCETPYMFSSLHLTDLDYIEVCDSPANDGPKNPGYEKPAFLRPRAIFLSLLSVGVVLGLGVIIGLFIVCLKRRLKNNRIAFSSSVRYTSVRESTASKGLPRGAIAIQYVYE